MKVLVCASARAEVVMNCISELSPQAEITVAAPRGVAEGLDEFAASRPMTMVRLKEASFAGGQELSSLKETSFDTAVVVSGGLGFTGFQNVIKSIAGLRFRQLLFYNQIGCKSTIQIPSGFCRTLERAGVFLLEKLFRAFRPMGLFVERMYIQCAELLGL